MTETKEEYSDYQLRRIGLAATCPRVLNIMKLKLGWNRFGRSPNNDFILDSIALTNFISRLHAEIFAHENEESQQFELIDRGLNGTFVNDIRMNKTCVLEEGDKITFGHTNGYKIKPGQFSCQAHSEFHFVFEHIPRAEDHFSNMSNGICQETTLPLSAGEFGRNESYTPEQNNDVICAQETCAVDVTSKGAIVIESDDDEQDVQDVPINLSVANSPQKQTPASGDSVHNDTHETPKIEGKTLTIGREIVFPVRELQTLERSGSSSSSSEKENNSRVPDPYNFTSDDSDDGLRDKVNSAIKRIEHSFSVSEEDIFTGVKKKKSKEKPNKNTDDKSKKNQPIQNSKKRKNTDTNIQGKRNGRRRKRNSGSDDEQLEDGVEWYEEDSCASVDCKRPRHKRVQWVQCDDCDSWYHTECVGCNYDRVKDAGTNFTCGCSIEIT